MLKGRRGEEEVGLEWGRNGEKGGKEVRYGIRKERRIQGEKKGGLVGNREGMGGNMRWREGRGRDRNEREREGED